MNELQTFQNSEFRQLRTVMIDSVPWFVGKDVATALGYMNPQKAIRDHVDEEDRTVNESFTVNGTPPTVINESGLYSLILSSKLDGAKRFKRWVTSEVLPAIRIRGSYTPTDDTPGNDMCRMATTDDFLKAAQIVATCKNERLPYVLSFLNQAGIPTPQVKYYNANLPFDAVKAMIQVKEEMSLSNAELGRIIGLDRVQTSRYLSGAIRPSHQRAEHIINCLKSENE